MAKIGLKYPVFGILTEATSGNTYGAMKEVAKAIKADIKLQKSDAKLYANNVIAESDNSVTGGTVSLEIDDLSDEVYVALMGHSKVAETEELVAKGGDTSPFVGFGFYGTKIVNNVRKYRAIFLPKVKFAEPDDNNSTGGETTSFATQTIEGTVILLDDGTWKFEQTFDTEAEAKEYLASKFSTQTT